MFTRLLIFATLVTISLSAAPLLNVFINQTSTGRFTIHLPGPQVNENNLVNFTSLWMQDDLNKRLYISVGEPEFGDKACSGRFWFTKDGVYELLYENFSCSGTTTCHFIEGFGYDKEVEHYSSKYMGWVGKLYIQTYLDRESIY
jgi:hypothetical protein